MYIVIRNILILLVIVSSFSCKNEFDQIRKSNDVEAKYTKAIEYFEKEDWYKSQYLIGQVMPFMKGDERLTDLYFKYAYTYYNMGQYLSSSYYFKDFGLKFPRTPMAEEAQFMTAYSNYELSPIHRLDQTYTSQAIEGFQYFINLNPDSKRIEECNRLIDKMRQKMEDKSFAEGELYYNLQNYQSATHSFENMLKDFPDSPLAEKAQYLMIKSSYKLALNSIDAKKAERFAETLKFYKEFDGRYGKSSYRRELKGIYKKSKSQLKIYQNS